jgi:hypothetical protein
MEILDWMRGAARLHVLLHEAAARTAPVVLPIAKLHEPHAGPDGGAPVCHGCDGATGAPAGAAWPCRTYALLCRGLLDVTNIPETMVRLNH